MSWIKPCISLNSLADGAHASFLQKSCSQAICSFCPVHTIFFFPQCFLSLMTKSSVGFWQKPKWSFHSHSHPAPAVTLMFFRWEKPFFCWGAFVQRLCPTWQKPTPITACLSQLQNEALEEFDIVSVCWSLSSGAGVNTTHMFCLSLCSLWQFSSLVLPKICSRERKVRQMLTIPF